VTMGYNYIGAQADINVWNPKVPEPNEFTTAQIWLKNDNHPYFESVEAGWMVSILKITSLLNKYKLYLKKSH